MNNKIRVIHLIPNLGIGGAERVLVNICNKIDKTKFDLTVLYWGDDESLLPQLKATEVNIIRLNTKKIISLDLIFKIAKILKNSSADILHTHFMDSDFLGFCAAFLTRTPMICHIHTHHPFLEVIRHRIRYFFMAFFIKKFICVSEKVSQYFLESTKINRRKVEVIYNGIQIDQRFENKGKLFSNQLKVSLGINLEHAVIGNVSRMVPIKGQKYILTAIPKILKIYPKTSFLFVGDGKSRAELEKLTDELNIRNNVIFTGIRFDIPELLNVIDIFILSSFYEAMGLVIVEAMAAGKPIIATEDAVSELITPDEDGILIPSHNSDAIADSTLKLMNAPDLCEKIGQRAKQKALRFSDDKMVEQIQALYEKIR
ncbi:MAG: glycosyltransferase [Candidatus Omnitrophica bacterium]|nr:glycosyltransferase [Candidatus Omnitrophota bacterium]